MDKLNHFKKTNPDSPVANNFKKYWLSDSDNIIIIELDDLNETQILKFKNQVIDSPMIEFRQSSGKVEIEASLKPGQAFYSSYGEGSIGYRAKRNGVNGIVTSGHMASIGSKLSTTVSTDTIFGEVVAKKMSGSVDALFAKITDTNYTPSNTLYGASNALSTTISEPGVGTVINKIGCSTGHTSGKVLSTNASVTIDSTTYTNLTSADYSSAKGDSGGIVYSYISNTNARLTLGIHMASDGSTRYYVKANEINSALGTSRY